MFITQDSEIRKMGDPAVRAVIPDDDRHVVHESKSQRQHTRVILPAFLEFDTQERRHQAKLCELSVGGFSVRSPALSQSITSGDIKITIDRVSILFHVNFQVQYIDTATGRRGCVFHDMSPSQIAGLRSLIASYLNGSTIAVGDFLHQLGQDNFVKRRSPQQEDEESTNRKRRRAMIISGVLFVIGLFAFGYLLYQMHDLFFVTRAQSARVAGPVYTIVMPRAGTFYSLVPDDLIVKKGTPIASFETPLSELMPTMIPVEGMAPDPLSRLPGATVKGTVTSPCDCRVQTQFVADIQYVNKGQALFELIPNSLEKVHIAARFRSDQVDRLVEGTLVQFRVSGEGKKRIGRVAQVKVEVANKMSDSYVTLIIQPLTPLEASWMGRPVEVMAGGIGSLFISGAAPAAHE